MRTNQASRTCRNLIRRVRVSRSEWWLRGKGVAKRPHFAQINSGNSCRVDAGTGIVIQHRAFSKVRSHPLAEPGFLVVFPAAVIAVGIKAGIVATRARTDSRVRIGEISRADARAGCLVDPFKRLHWLQSDRFGVNCCFVARAMILPNGRTADQQHQYGGQKKFAEVMHWIPPEKSIGLRSLGLIIDGSHRRNHSRIQNWKDRRDRQNPTDVYERIRSSVVSEPLATREEVSSFDRRATAVTISMDVREPSAAPVPTVDAEDGAIVRGSRCSESERHKRCGCTNRPHLS